MSIDAGYETDELLSVEEAECLSRIIDSVAAKGESRWTDVEKELPSRLAQDPFAGRLDEGRREAVASLVRRGLHDFFASLEELRLGETFEGRYEVLERIAEGSTGTVFLARDVKLDIRVVLKELVFDFGEHEAATRWLEEARLQAAVPHPSVVKVYDVHRTARGAIIVMEFVHAKGDVGRSAPNGAEVSLSHAQSVRAAYEVADVLATAHRYGILHRDVTPMNIGFMHVPDPVLEPEESAHVRVFDFGLNTLYAATAPRGPSDASVSEVQVEGDGSVLRVRGGTRAFMAPERAEFVEIGSSRQAPSDNQKRGDIFELAATLHYWVTRGKTVWPAEATFDDIRKRARPEVFLPFWHARLQRILRKALAPVNERYATMEAFKSDLWRYSRGLPSSQDGWWTTRALHVWALRAPIATLVLVVMSVLVLFTGRELDTAKTRLADAESGYQLREEQRGRERVESDRRLGESVRLAVDDATRRMRKDGEQLLNDELSKQKTTLDRDWKKVVSDVRKEEQATAKKAVTAARTEEQMAAKKAVEAARTEEQVAAKKAVDAARTEEQVAAKKAVETARTEEQVAAKKAVDAARTEEQVAAKKVVDAARTEEQLAAKKAVNAARTEEQLAAKKAVDAARTEEQLAAKKAVDAARTEEQVAAKKAVDAARTEEQLAAKKALDAARENEKSTGATNADSGAHLGEATTAGQGKE